MFCVVHLISHCHKGYSSSLVLSLTFFFFHCFSLSSNRSCLLSLDFLWDRFARFRKFVLIVSHKIQWNVEDVEKWSTSAWNLKLMRSIMATFQTNYSEYFPSSGNDTPSDIHLMLNLYESMNNNLIKIPGRNFLYTFGIQ